MKLFVDDDEDDDESLSHFTIELLGTSATESDILYVALSGADRELELQKPLEPIGNDIFWTERKYRKEVLLSILLYSLTELRHPFFI